MIRVFKHFVPASILVLAVFEFIIIVGAIYAGVIARYVVAADGEWAFSVYIPEVVTFAAVLGVTMFSLGLYQRLYVRHLRTNFIRLVTSYTIAFVAFSLVFYVVPDLQIWRSALLIALVLSFIGIMTTRILLVRTADLDRFRRRILVLGTGRRAAQIADLESRPHADFLSHGYVPLGDHELAVDPDRVLSEVADLAEFAHSRCVEEVVVAIEDWRGGVPTQALLECKLNGITVTSFTSFWERETGSVNLDAVNPSWLIFSDGFSGGGLQAFVKRLFDIVVSVAVLTLMLPVLLLTALAIAVESGGPVFYRQERTGRGGKPFMVIKFRSMRCDAERDGVPKWASSLDPRITRVGALIRKTRIDEIPQVLNVLMGDMSFVGPRPERPYFVEQLCEELPFYVERHRVKPGITGWAQLNYPYGASNEDAKHKLEYDLYYLKNFSVFLDFVILLQTVRVVLWPESARSVDSRGGPLAAGFDRRNAA
jgi:sugar transferase (PEP-CTERM system associated)